jgi:hypothetical protein
MFFHYYIVSLSKSPWSVHIFCIFKSVVVRCSSQHPLMVQVASSSKSTRSQAKSTAKKKPAAVSIAKAKQTKQQSVKKNVRTGKYFFLLSGGTSDVELDKMKIQRFPRKMRRQVGVTF